MGTPHTRWREMHQAAREESMPRRRARELGGTILITSSSSVVSDDGSLPTASEARF